MTELRDLPSAVARCRRLFDLDADPVAVDEALGGDSFLAPMVARHPGLRSPGHVDGTEVAVRAVLGQHVSVAAARTVAGRLAARFGTPLPSPVGTLSHLFPTAEQPARLSPAELPLPAARAGALITLAAAIADGSVCLDPGADRAEAAARLRHLPGIGAWTAGYMSAGSRRSRCLSVHRPRRPPGPCSGRVARRRRPRAALETVAVLRSASPLAKQERRSQHCRPARRHRPLDRPECAVTVRFDTLESPIGQLLVTAGDRGVTGIYLAGARHAPTPRPEWAREPGSFLELAGQLANYFRGSRTEFSLPLAPSGTPFQLRVWEALRTIPYGTTASYREVANRIGQPTATRAIGLANGRNPLSIVVPCHRVIGADGSLTGYAGGLERKQLLLDLERAHRR